MTRIRRATDDDLDEVAALDHECFKGELPHDFSGDHVWVAVDRLCGTDLIVAYGSAKESRLFPGWVYLTRAGVSEPYRGCGLQKRLIRARTRWAGSRPVYTYTLDNPASCNALIGCGFRLFEPGFTVGHPAERWWLRRPSKKILTSEVA
jgi:GNAT superfamily N-acetyltransferase